MNRPADSRAAQAAASIASSSWPASPGVPRVSLPEVLGPSTANDGVPVKPSVPLPPSWLRLRQSFADLLRSLFHLAMSATPAPSGDFGEEFVGHVAGGLQALVSVEELDEAPAAALLAGGDRRRAGRSRFLVDDREVPELDLRFAAADLGVDHVRNDFFREPFADRALEVAELVKRHLGARLAEHEAVLGNPLQLACDQAHVLEVACRRHCVLLRADDDQRQHHRNHEECRGAADLQQPLAALSLLALTFGPQPLFAARLPGFLPLMPVSRRSRSCGWR